MATLPIRGGLINHKAINPNRGVAGLHVAGLESVSIGGQSELRRALFGLAFEESSFGRQLVSNDE